MTLGKKAYGTLLHIGEDTSPGSYTKIDEMFSLAPVGSTGGLIDFSNHDTLIMMDYEAQDLEDGNTVAVQCNEIPGNASQNLVRASRTAKTKLYWKVIFKNGATEIFQALVTSLNTDASDLMGRQIFAFELKITGQIYRTTA